MHWVCIPEDYETTSIHELKLQKFLQESHCVLWKEVLVTYRGSNHITYLILDSLGLSSMQYSFLLHFRPDTFWFRWMHPQGMVINTIYNINQVAGAIIKKNRLKDCIGLLDPNVLHKHSQSFITDD